MKEYIKMIEAKNFIEDIINEELAEGKVSEVHTRFPPEPNGYLHIGHAKSLCLNFGTAKKYGGKCNLFFDDTNPSKEKTEFVEAIKADIEWLGFKWFEMHYASDFFDTIYELAVKLIKDGKAYVCDLTADQILFVFSLANKKEDFYKQCPALEEQCWVRAHNPNLLVMNQDVPSISTWDRSSRSILQNHSREIENNTNNRDKAVQNNTNYISDLCKEYGILESIISGIGTAIGFFIAIVIMAGIRERIEDNDIPNALKGMPIVLVTAGLMAIAFIGFSGLI